MAGAAAGALAAIAGCGGEGSSGTPSPSPTPSPTPALTPTPTPTPTPSPTPGSSTRLVLWGDSRTEGVGDVAPAVFPIFVRNGLPTLEIVGAGRSGQTTAQIVARQNGEPTRLTIAGNIIPAAGVVDVTSATANIFFYAGDENAAGTIPGSLSGVAGHYASDGLGGHTFTRAASGGSANVPVATPFLTDLGSASRDAIMFMCAGRNGIELDDPDETVRLIQAAVGYLTGARRAIVASVMPDSTAPTGTAFRARFDALNARLSAAFAEDYLDLTTPPTDVELSAVGFVPSAAERADILSGIYPSRMFVDTVHLQREGQQIWANRVIARVKARNWV